MRMPKVDVSETRNGQPKQHLSEKLNVRCFEDGCSIIAHPLALDAASLPIWLFSNYSSMAASAGVEACTQRNQAAPTQFQPGKLSHKFHPSCIKLIVNELKQS